MKVLLRALCVGFVFAVLASLVTFEGECREISNEVFRVHILANSDSEEDQTLKLKVRDAVVDKSNELLSDVHSKEEAKNIVNKNLNVFLNTAKDVIFSEGYDYDIKISVVNMYFDTRYYDNVTMPGGFYDALRIEIGKAEGKNWWCVMYPSLCLFSSSDRDDLDNKLSKKQYGIVTSKGKYKYKLRFVEMFNNFLDMFK